MDYGRMQAIKTFMILFGLLAIACLSSTAIAQDLDAIKAGVVKIRASSGQIGTGFIVRVEPDVVFIITAAHVVAGDSHPDVAFFTKRHVWGKGTVQEGAEVNDDMRGLALVQVHGKAQIPEGVLALSFGSSTDLVSGGEEALVIGHPGGGGNWAVLKRHISNRVGRDITLDPGVASRFSGGPIMVHDHVMGIVMTNRDTHALGITHKSVLNYLEGFDVVPATLSQEALGKVLSPSTVPQPGMATLVIETTPLDAQVFVDDEYVGETAQGPVVVRALEPEEYDVMVTKDGFRTWERTIHLHSGERRTLSAALQEGQALVVTGVWKNPAEPMISYVLEQQGNYVTMTEVTTSILGTMVTAQGEGQLQGNQLEIMYRTALGTMGQTTVTLSEDGQQLIGTFLDFSNMIPMAISLMRTGESLPAFSSP